MHPLDENEQREAFIFRWRNAVRIEVREVIDGPVFFEIAVESVLNRVFDELESCPQTSVQESSVRKIASLMARELGRKIERRLVRDGVLELKEEDLP